MATSQELDKLPRQFRSRTNAAVINITTPEVQPNLGKLTRNASAKKMLFNVQEEGAKTSGRKQRRAQRDNPVIDPNIDKRMLKRGIYSDINDRTRSATILPLHPSSHADFEVVPSAQDRRASLPYLHHNRDVNVQQSSVNGSPQHFTPPAPGQSMDSGVDMDTVELTQIRPQVLSNSLDDLTEQRSRTNSTQVQFPLSLANNVMGNVTTVPGCSEHSGHVLNQHGDCIVCDVLRSEPLNKALPVNHTTPEQKETALHNRDSGVGNELQLNVLTNTNSQVGMLSNKMLPSPSKGLEISRSVELPSPSVDSRSSREKDFFETTNDLAKASMLGSECYK